jgi:hypothetical protein
MSVPRLRLYRWFPTLPDSRALLSLLRLHAIAFETRYERGESYGGKSYEPDRLTRGMGERRGLRASKKARGRAHSGASTRVDRAVCSDCPL